MFNEILKDERIVDFIVKSVIGIQNQNNYTTKAPEWIDNKEIEVVYVPTKATEALRPILVEVQNTVDKLFLKRTITYCGHLIDEYDIEPIVFIFSIHAIPSQIADTLTDTDTANYLKVLPSFYWAQEAYVLDFKIIKESLSETPLPPLVAIEYVLSKQEQSLSELEKKDDRVVQLLYKISKKALVDSQTSANKKTVDIVVDICDNTIKQFERILDVLQEDVPDMKRIKQYALEGIRYTESCISKYSSFQGFSSSSILPEPIDLPINAEPSTNYQAQQQVSRNVLIPERKTDMQWAQKFVDQRKEENKRMSWKNCYELGLTEGYFKSYKNYLSLKSSFHYRRKTEQTEQS